MTQATPDLFRIRDHVADFEAFVAEYRRRSQATLARRQPRHRVAYGPHPDERLDLYVPVLAAGAAPLPLHMFIHGGYWRAYSKDDYCFVADAIAAAGAIAAIVDYSLMPIARMATLVDQVRRAMGWLAHNAASFGGAAEALSVSGHSAGGHLAAMMLSCLWNQVAKDLPRGLVRSALAISGVFDLEPLCHTPFLKDDLKLTGASARALSPAFFPAPAGSLSAVVGAEESEEFLRQNELIRQAWGPRVVSVCEQIPGTNHLNVLHNFADSKGRLHDIALQLLGLTRAAAS